jgi:Fe-S oxidoreductase
MKFALAGISYLITVIALVLLFIRVRQLIAIYKKQQPDPTRNNDKPARFKNMLKEVLGHTKMLNFTGSGIAHWFVMIGFGALFGTLVTAYGQVIRPDFALPIIGHFVGYELFAELIAALTGIGIVTLIGIRQVTRFRMLNRFSGSGMGKAYYIEATILAIVFCVIALRGLEGALAGEKEWNWHYAISWPAVLAFNSMSVASLESAIVIVATLKIVVSMAWFIVIASNFTMGIAWHRFLAFFNIFYSRNIDKPALGALPEMLSKGKPVNFEDPAEDDVFGLGTRGDISWKGLLDMTSCTECGRCQSQCPAWHTDKPLSPKLLIMAMRDHAMAKVVDTENLVGENAPIELDVLWSCTSCGACVEECPVDIEHVDHIVNMRRFQVLVESEFPAELGGTFRNLEKTGNPWGANKQDRESWIAECDFPVRVVSGELPEEVEYLFWVGCAGAYEDRAKKTTKAVAELLHMAGVNFAVLGKRETCTGDSARRSGNEYLFQMLALPNIEMMNGMGVKKIITQCPHCFNTLKNEYPQLGGNYEVVHHSEFLEYLIDSGKLDMRNASLEDRIVYHDSCYLGRHNDVYMAPRKVVGSIKGLQIVEMPRNGTKGMCCGAGGARMWMEESIGVKVNDERAQEAISTGAGRVATACPFCYIMLDDGVKAAGAEEDQVKVADIAIHVLEALENGEKAMSGQDAPLAGSVGE